MALVPKNFRYWLFDMLSIKTMRYVDIMPRNKGNELVKAVYDQIADDFFINGSLTSRSKVAKVFAAIWVAGRETILVDDYLDRTTKEAIAGTLSSVNDCPYCGDMLVSLAYAGGRSEDAEKILSRSEQEITDPLLRERLKWIRQVTTPGQKSLTNCPFDKDQLT